MVEDLLRHTQGQKSSSKRLLKDSQKRKSTAHHHKKNTSISKITPGIVDNSLRCRHEIKYVITEAQAAAITRFIKPYLHYDHYCKLQPSHTYSIVSLYLDSANLRLCRESLEGHKNRFKLRIRSYSDNHDYPCFLEIKRRINRIIMKSRSRIRHSDIVDLLAGKNVPIQNKADEEIFRQFQLYMHSINAGPVVRIRYMRQAYENDSENRVRVTFDRDLCYNIKNSSELSLNGRNWRRHNLKGVVLEIKFTGRYPVWLSQMAKCLNLEQQSMSKYATSIKRACTLGFCAPLIPMQYSM